MALDGNSEKCDAGSWLLMCGCGRVVVSAGDCLGFFDVAYYFAGRACRRLWLEKSGWWFLML